MVKILFYKRERVTPLKMISNRVDHFYEGVVKSRRVPHQPKHHHPVERQDPEQRQCSTIQTAREVFRFPVESENMRYHPRELVSLREVEVGVSIVESNPVASHGVEVVSDLIRGKS